MHDLFPPFRMQEDPDPIRLSAEDERELAEIYQHIRELENQISEFRRRKAWERGHAAKRLEDLRSKSGKPYLEIERRDGRRGYRRASTGERFDEEVAYFCAPPPRLFASPHDDEEIDTCGWVKGYPEAEAYDTIRGSALAGSAGYLFYCKICKRKIGEQEQWVS